MIRLSTLLFTLSVSGQALYMTALVSQVTRVTLELFDSLSSHRLSLLTNYNLLFVRHSNTVCFVEPIEFCIHKYYKSYTLHIHLSDVV